MASKRRGNGEGGIYHLKDGRWEARIMTGMNSKGKPKFKTFTSRKRKEVADKLGISQSYISRLEKRIITRLQREIKKLG